MGISIKGIGGGGERVRVALLPRILSALTSSGMTEIMDNWGAGGWKGDAVVRVLAFYQFGQGSIPGHSVICGLLLLVLVSRVFPGLYGSPPSTKTNTSKFQFDFETRVTQCWGRSPANNVARLWFPDTTVEFVVGSRSCSKGFLGGSQVFLPPKNQPF